MKILIYGINFWPELTSTGKYTGELAHWLAERGHDIRIVTAPPYYPAWRVRPDYSWWRYRKEEQSRVVVWRCPLWVPRRPRGVTRILHLLSFAASSFLVLLAQTRWRPQVVLVVAPTMFCAPASWLVARLSGCGAWLHVQDFELDVAVGLGLIRRGPLGRLAARLERFWLRRFDRVSTISDRMIERLEAKGVSENARVLFPNWVDCEAIKPSDVASPMRAELGISEGTIVALYAGNMGQKQGLEVILDAAARLAENPSVLFLLAGEGAAKPALERLSRRMSNVRWLPLQPMDRLNDLLNLADVHLLPQRADAADLVMPSKLTGMLASGRPVVATAAVGTQVQKVVEGCGRVVPPGDVVALAKSVEELASDEGQRITLGRRGREYAVQYLSKDNVLEEFALRLEELTTGNSNGRKAARG